MTYIDLPRARLNALARSVERITRDVLAREPELMASKWPDYGFIDPFQATIMFGEQFRETFKHFWAKDIDKYEAESVRGINLDTVASRAREFTQLWKARQEADARGLAYGTYLHFCFEFAQNRRRAKLPQPNQLGPNKKTRDAWEAEFAKFMEEERERCRFPARLPQFDMRHYKALPVQTHAREVIIELAKPRTASWLSTARTWSVKHRMLPLAMVQEQVSVEAFDHIRSSLEEDCAAGRLTSVRKPEVKDVDFLQACFGLPVGERSLNDVCRACPHQKQCQEAEVQVLAKVRERNGNDDPKLAHRRERGRQRTARYRENRKATANPTREAPLPSPAP